MYWLYSATFDPCVSHTICRFWQRDSQEEEKYVAAHVYAYPVLFAALFSRDLHQ